MDTLVLHYTGMESAAAAIDRLCDPAAAVSAHYVVCEDGAVWALVPETLRAWHAGDSAWRGAEGLNGRSIGIEIVNPGHAHGYVPFGEAQMVAVIGLCREIIGRWPIDPLWVVGHSDIAPDRKQDPGELFDWRRLAAAGIGVFPEGVRAPRAEAAALLAAIGYDTRRAGCVAAFQRRFRAGCVNGVVDAETHGRLQAVAEGYGGEK